MPGMTLANLRSTLRRHIDDRNSERFTDAELLEELNNAQRDVQLIVNQADEGFFSACQSYSVVASTDSYEFSLPTNLMKVILAERETTGVPIPAEWVDFRRRHVDSWNSDALDQNAQETPRCYLRGNKVGVVAPSVSYTLRVWYTYAIADLANDSDESEIPAEHRDLLTLQAAKRIVGSSDPSGAIPEWLADELKEQTDLLRLTIEKRHRQASREVAYDPEL